MKHKGSYRKIEPRENRVFTNFYTKFRKIYEKTPNHHAVAHAPSPHDTPPSIHPPSSSFISPAQAAGVACLLRHWAPSLATSWRGEISFIKFLHFLSFPFIIVWEGVDSCMLDCSIVSRVGDHYIVIVMSHRVLE